MSDERLKLQMVDAVYGELDARALGQLREALAKDPQLDADLRSLEATRQLYAEDVLPEPAALLSEAILRQEKILRQAPEPWWSRLWQLAWHPAVGLTALIVVVATAGLLVKLATPPAADQTAPVAAVAPVLAPAPALPSAVPIVATGAAVEQPLAGDKPDEKPADKRGVIDGLLPGGPSPDTAQVRAAEAAAVPEPEPAATKDAKRKTAAREAQRGSAEFKELEESQSFEERKAPSAWEASRGRALSKATGEALDDESARRTEADQLPAGKAGTWDPRRETTASADVAERRVQRADDGETSKTEAPTYAQRSNKPHPATPFVQAPQAGPAVGSAGQLTDPAILGRDADAPAGAASNVAATGNLGDRAGISSGSGTQAPAKKARPLPSLQGQAPREQIQTELGQIGKLQYAQKAESYLNAGEVAFDRRAFDEALGHFVRAQQLDRANAMAPLPQLGQARSLFKLKRYRDAAAIYERVLDGYPSYTKREQVALQLASCYEAMGNTVAATRARRIADESRAVLDDVDNATAAPPAAAEPAQATPAAK